jgi:small subunit ribosomal protein S1
MGDEHEAMIVSIDKDERKMSLSIKKMTQDPWDEIESKFAVGSQHIPVW